MSPHARRKTEAGDIAYACGLLDGIVDHRGAQLLRIGKKPLAISGGLLAWRPPSVRIQQFSSSGSIRPPRLCWGAWPNVRTPFQSTDMSSEIAKIAVAYPISTSITVI